MSSELIRIKDGHPLWLRSILLLLENNIQAPLSLKENKSACLQMKQEMIQWVRNLLHLGILRNIKSVLVLQKSYTLKLLHCSIHTYLLINNNLLLVMQELKLSSMGMSMLSLTGLLYWAFLMSSSKDLCSVDLTRYYQCQENNFYNTSLSNSKWHLCNSSKEIRCNRSSCNNNSSRCGFNKPCLGCNNQCMELLICNNNLALILLHKCT